MQVLRQRVADDRQQRAIAITETARDKQHQHDDVPHPCRSLGHSPIDQVRSPISLLSSASSASLTSTSGERTGPAGLPIALIPAFTIDTAYPRRRLRIAMYRSTKSRRPA